MADLFAKEYNTRTRFTRMCIGEALFALLDKKEYKDIRISDVVKRAGVSRMTFYHYYESKEDALSDYFHEIVAGYVHEVEKSRGQLGHFHDRRSIMHALTYYDQYAGFILKIVHAGLYSIIIDAMNAYLLERIRPVYQISAYELYFYGGALLNVFVQWQEGGKKETAETIAETITAGIAVHTKNAQMLAAEAGEGTRENQ